MNTTDFREVEGIRKALESIAKTLKDIHDEQKKANSNTNKNSVAAKLVDAVEKVATNIKTNSNVGTGAG